MTQAPPRSNVGRWLAAGTALMCALAGGAVWSVLTLRTGRELAWLAVVCAGVIAWPLRSSGFGGTTAGAAVAALFTAIACVYAQVLLGIGDVAQALGFSMRDTIVRIGVDFALAVVRGRIVWWETATWVAAMAVAAWLVVRTPRSRNMRSG